MALKDSKALRKVWEYMALVLGVFFYCAAWGCFMIPNDLSGGGLTGICTVIQYATDGAIPVSVSYAAINVVLLLIAFVVMGGKFGFKTIFCIALASVMFELFERVPQMHSVAGSFMFIPEKFLIPVIAGLSEGLGLGIIFRAGGSTGGSDIVALMINKFWPVSPGRFFLFSDILIIFSMLLLPGRAMADLIYGFLMVIASSMIIDAVVVGGRSVVQVMIFSERYAEIADYINREMNRGVTAIQAIGWYTRADKKVLFVILRQKEVFQLTKVVKELDKNAFLSVSPANNVYGEGFEQIKSGLKKKKKEQ